jgi:hypothetical protein
MHIYIFHTYIHVLTGYIRNVLMSVSPTVLANPLVCICRYIDIYVYRYMCIYLYLCCVHYSCLRGWIYVFYTGRIDKITLPHVVIWSKRPHQIGPIDRDPGTAERAVRTWIQKRNLPLRYWRLEGGSFERC